MNRFVHTTLLVLFALYGTGAFWFAHVSTAHNHTNAVLTSTAFAADFSHSDESGGDSSSGRCDTCDMLAAAHSTLPHPAPSVFDSAAPCGDSIVVTSIFSAIDEDSGWGARGPPAVV